MNRSPAGPPDAAVVTTGRKPEPPDIERALDLAARYGLTYVPREGLSIPSLQARLGPDGRDARIVVAGRDGLSLHARGVSFRYHPGMGVNRIRTIKAGGEDWMILAMGLGEGDAVLDATLGIGSDLLVASYVAGERGRAVGLESEQGLAIVVREGMKAYEHPLADVTAALRRIEVVHADYRHFLAARAEEKSFDVVYFDPMFSDPVEESKHMIPLRTLGNKAPLERADLERARRVARRRVVVKDRKEGPYAASGWFDRVVGGPRSRICYCVLDAEPK